MVDMFCLMIDKIQAPFKYPSDDVRMDIRSFAIEQLVKKWKSCDINRPNLFSFFTQVIKNDLYAGWNSYKRGCADFSYSTIFTDDV
ncbi:hypothetical protein [Tenacibaculum phage PTm5]|nr:hypothetical protein [Tenacibaculum phage PTm5]